MASGALGSSRWTGILGEIVAAFGKAPVKPATAASEQVGEQQSAAATTRQETNSTSTDN